MRGPRSRSDWLPLLTLLLIGGLAIGAYWAVPALMRTVKHQDCIARGSLDC